MDAEAQTFFIITSGENFVGRKSQNVPRVCRQSQHVKKKFV